MGYTMCSSLRHTLFLFHSLTHLLTPTIPLYSLSYFRFPFSTPSPFCLYMYLLVTIFPSTNFPPALTQFSLYPISRALQNSLTHCALRTGSSAMVTVLSKERQKRLHLRPLQLQETKSENLSPPLYWRKDICLVSCFVFEAIVWTTLHHWKAGISDYYELPVH